MSRNVLVILNTSRVRELHYCLAPLIRGKKTCSQTRYALCKSRWCTFCHAGNTLLKLLIAHQVYYVKKYQKTLPSLTTIIAQFMINYKPAYSLMCKLQNCVSYRVNPRIKEVLLQPFS